MATIFFRTLIVYFLVSLVLRLMGKRQVGELELSDLVATLLLSEVAALPIADHNMPLLNGLLPVLLILSLEILLTYLKNKSHLLKKILEGRPSILIYKGRLDQRELARMRLSIEELLGECRLQGYADLCEIDYAILEQDGQLSILPKAGERPLTPNDLHLSPLHRGLAHPIILDGQIHDDQLSLLGWDHARLRAACTAQGLQIEEVFLMTVNDAGEVSITPKDL